MKRYPQQLLLIVFALLQCAAPLVHAHADGMNVDDTPYVHEVSSAHERSVHTGGAHEAISHAERQVGAIVSVPHAYPACDSPSLGGASIEHVSRIQVPQIIVVADSFNDLISSSISISRLRYSFVWSQAPPAPTPLV